MVVSENLIPYKRMRRILRQELNGEITEQSVKYLQTVLENQLKEICRDVVILHQEQNRLREFHHIPKLKRIHLNEFLNLLVTRYKPTTDLMVEGEVGQHNSETTLSDKQDIEVA